MLNTILQIENDLQKWTAQRETLLEKMALAPDDDELATQAARLGAKLDAIPRRKELALAAQSELKERERREKLEADKKQVEKLLGDAEAARHAEERKRRAYFEAAQKARDTEQAAMQLAENIARRDPSFELSKLAHTLSVHEALLPLMEMIGAVLSLAEAGNEIAKPFKLQNIVVAIGAALRELDPAIMDQLLRFERSVARAEAIRRAERRYREGLDAMLKHAGHLKSNLIALHPPGNGTASPEVLLPHLAGKVDQSVLTHIIRSYEE